MKIGYLIILVAAGLGSLHAGAQESSRNRFIDNLVMLPNWGEYGFVTGHDPHGGNCYFVVIRDKDKFDDKLTVSFNKDKGREAYREDVLLRVGKFYVAIYRTSFSGHIETHFYKHTEPFGPGRQVYYYTFRDAALTGTGKVHAMMDASLNFQLALSRQDDRSRYMDDPVTFSSQRRDNFVLGGMPVVDADGDLCGLIAESKPDFKYSSTFYVLDIYAISKRLLDAGAKMAQKEGDACRWFNLIARGAPNGETPCEQSTRQRKEDEKMRKIEEDRRVEQLKQTEKKTIDRLYAEGNREHTVKRIHRRNIDRPFAISVGGTGMINYTSMQVPADSGFTKHTATARGSYGFCANLHFMPDHGHVRLTFKPRYVVYELSAGPSYTYGVTASGYKLNIVRVKTYEVPAVLELVLNRKETGDAYFGLGFSVGKQQSMSFDYTVSGDNAPQREEVLNPPKYTQKILAEVGWDANRVRFSVYLSYQINKSFPNDYQIALGGQTIQPLRDMPKGFITLGADLSIRLWNQWRNDYRTMFR